MQIHLRLPDALDIPAIRAKAKTDLTPPNLGYKPFRSSLDVADYRAEVLLHPRKSPQGRLIEIF